LAPTVAIAPFGNLSADPHQDYFAQGFVEDVATELSRFGTLEVLHPRVVAAGRLTWRSAAPAHYALATATRAIRLYPSCPPWYIAPLGLALFCLGRDGARRGPGHVEPAPSHGT